MATAPAQSTQAPNQLGQLQSLLTLLTGGQKTTQTTSPGDVTALQQLLGQLQGADYSSLLQGIFSQAGGQIPGLQVALGNAMGARSGNNSAVSGALQQLLKQTALEGQQQVTSQQLQNQQIQAQAGNSVAQATRGTSQTSGGKSQLGQLAGVLGLAQGALKLTGSKDMTELFGKLGGVAGPAGTSGNANPAAGASGMGLGGFTPSVGTAPLMDAGVQFGTAINVPGAQQTYTEAMPFVPDMTGEFSFDGVAPTPGYSADPAFAGPVQLSPGFQYQPAGGDAFVDNSGVDWANFDQWWL